MWPRLGSLPGGFCLLDERQRWPMGCGEYGLGLDIWLFARPAGRGVCLGGHGLGSGLDWMRGWSRSMGWGESLVRPTGQRQYGFGIRFAVLWGPRVGGSTVWIKHAVFGGPTELGSELLDSTLGVGLHETVCRAAGKLGTLRGPTFGAGVRPTFRQQQVDADSVNCCQRFGCLAGLSSLRFGCWFPARFPVSLLGPACLGTHCSCSWSLGPSGGPVFWAQILGTKPWTLLALCCQLFGCRLSSATQLFVKWVGASGGKSARVSPTLATFVASYLRSFLFHAQNAPLAQQCHPCP